MITGSVSPHRHNHQKQRRQWQFSPWDEYLHLSCHLFSLIHMICFTFYLIGLLSLLVKSSILHSLTIQFIRPSVYSDIIISSWFSLQSKSWWLKIAMMKSDIWLAAARTFSYIIKELHLHNRSAESDTTERLNWTELNWIDLQSLPLTKDAPHLAFPHMLCFQSLSHVWLFVIPWSPACEAPLSMGISRQNYWSGLPFLLPLRHLRSPFPHTDSFQIKIL